MFPSRYYANRMFAPRYFPKVGAEAALPTSGEIITAKHRSQIIRARYSSHIIKARNR